MNPLPPSPVRKEAELFHGFRNSVKQLGPNNSHQESVMNSYSMTPFLKVVLCHRLVSFPIHTCGCSPGIEPGPTSPAHLPYKYACTDIIKGSAGIERCRCYPPPGFAAMRTLRVEIGVVTAIALCLAYNVRGSMFSRLRGTLDTCVREHKLECLSRVCV